MSVYEEQDHSSLTSSEEKRVLADYGGVEIMDERNEKEISVSTINHVYRAQLLLSGELVHNVATWCNKHSRGRRLTMAVVWFDTDEAARLFLRLKAPIAREAGIGYTSTKLRADVSLDEVLSAVAKYNNDDSIQGILIQRPLPAHLPEDNVMNSIARSKDVEEFKRRKASNIALDALTRHLDFYKLTWMLNLNVILLGGLSIITRPFRAELSRRHHHFQWIPTLDVGTNVLRESTRDTVIITELNKAGAVKADMIGPGVKLVVDLGFDAEAKRGDLDPDVLDVEGLLVAPTPKGVMPLLLFTMMERTIQNAKQLGRLDTSCGVYNCAVL